MNNKQRALEAIQEHSGEFTASELADYLEIKYALTMKLIHLEAEGKAHIKWIDVEWGPFKLKKNVPKWFIGSDPKRFPTHDIRGEISK